MTWTTDTSGSINYCPVFVENDCILLKKPLHSENLQLSLLRARVTEWRSGSRWKPVRKSDRTNLEDTEGALLGCEPRHAGRQKDRARILKCASIVFQDILSSPLRNGTVGKAWSRLRWGRGVLGERLEKCCHVVSNDFPSKGLKLSLSWFFSAAVSERSIGVQVERPPTRKRTTVSTNGRGGEWEGLFTPQGRRLCSLLIINSRPSSIHLHWPQKKKTTPLASTSALLLVYFKCSHTLLCCLPTEISRLSCFTCVFVF